MIGTESRRGHEGAVRTDDARTDDTPSAGATYTAAVTTTVLAEAMSAEAAAIAETVSAEAAASGLGAEMVRLMRLFAAWTQRAGFECGAADRVLLARLVTCGRRRATDLAGDVFLDLSTVSRQVRSLVDRGLVERHPDPEDRRGSLLSATEAGRTAYRSAVRRREAELTRLLEPWPAEDRALLTRLLKRLNDDLVDSTYTSLGTGQHPVGEARQGDLHA
ncbi:MarR family winged helix-turn-helix transcriptional regulator [Streptomyces sp. LaBMicrA B280]|uniref:MarR family winged helix-turn-helix transcriptional regulator n=1 Tax=Streptomyces sp. LaBMicrA B280 TaxID=3391001 RepID=UPI003BA3EC2B